MRKSYLAILTALIVALPATALWAAGEADDTTGVLTRPPFGSRARQANLKLKLIRELTGGTLAVSLDHSRQQWEMLSPDQRESFRREAVAFLKKNPNEQARLMDRYTAFLRLSNEKRQAFRERAKWLKVVAASFTPKQREDMQRMPPVERAKLLIARRDELVREGKLKLDEHPTTRPAAEEYQPTQDSNQPN